MAESEQIRGPELQVLMMVSALGAMLMGESNDLIMVFLGLEILSIALYVLAGMNARRNASGEAALKYFVLGAFSSAIFLYGIALVYGATGTTNLPQIADFLARNVLVHDGLLLAGLALLLVGFGFKVAAVPFHLWTPDVYQGSPTPITGFMAAVAKAGGFAGLLRVFVSSFPSLRSDWRPAVWLIAVMTLLLGASVALVQRDVKRMLAYSSINHAGFILLGLYATSDRGVSASLYYLFTYSLMAIGSFAVIAAMGGLGDRRHDIGEYRGLGRRSPALALAFTILLIGQAGLPPTTGFIAKFGMIGPVSTDGSGVVLSVIAMVSAVIASFFYLRIVSTMWLGATTTAGAADELEEEGEAAIDPAPAALALASAAGPAVAVEAGPVGTVTATAAAAATPTGAPAVPASIALTVAVCAAVTVVFGVWWAPLLDFAHRATLLIGR